MKTPALKALMTLTACALVSTGCQSSISDSSLSRIGDNQVSFGSGDNTKNSSIAQNGGTANNHSNIITNHYTINNPTANTTERNPGPEIGTNSCTFPVLGTLSVMVKPTDKSGNYWDEPNRVTDEAGAPDIGYLITFSDNTQIAYPPKKKSEDGGWGNVDGMESKNMFNYTFKDVLIKSERFKIDIFDIDQDRATLIASGEGKINVQREFDLASVEVVVAQTFQH